MSSMSTRPIISSMWRNPSCAIISRSCPAMKKKKLMTFFRLTAEPGPQHRILRGNAHRTGVQMTFAHHDAAQSHQWHGGKTKLLCAQQRRDRDVTPGLQLAVGLNPDAAAQIVQGVTRTLLRFQRDPAPRARPHV